MKKQESINGIEIRIRVADRMDATVENYIREVAREISNLEWIKQEIDGKPCVYETSMKIARRQVRATFDYMDKYSSKRLENVIRQLIKDVCDYATGNYDDGIIDVWGDRFKSGRHERCRICVRDNNDNVFCEIWIYKASCMFNC